MTFRRCDVCSSEDDVLPMPVTFHPVTVTQDLCRTCRESLRIRRDIAAAARRAHEPGGNHG